jgi:hypothetical protein
MLSVLGWFPLWQKDRRLTILLALTFTLQLYVVASWGDWSGSAAFGQRFFTNMSPAFVLGLAALLSTLQRRIPIIWLTASCVLFMIWNGLLIVRYALGDISRGGSVPLGNLVIGQFTIVPRQLGRILEILLRRQ